MKPSLTPASTRPPVPAVKPQAREGVAVGGSIRSTRRLKGLKLREMGERIGCSESMLSKIENSRVSPSLSMLGKIASCLDVSVADLFSPGELQQVVARAGSRPTLSLHGRGSSVERLVPPDGDHMLESNLHTLAPGAGSRGQLSHVGEEVGYVIEGEFELTVGTEVFRLAAGDSFSFRSEAPHGYRNPGRRVTRVLWASTPSRSGLAAAPVASPPRKRKA